MRKVTAVGEKKYFTIDEAAVEMGCNRATVYNRMKALGIEKTKFKLDRRAYVSAEEVGRMKSLKDNPWLAGTDERRHAEEPEAA